MLAAAVPDRRTWAMGLGEETELWLRLWERAAVSRMLTDAAADAVGLVLIGVVAGGAGSATGGTTSAAGIFGASAYKE